jgi:hypothetical protein
MWNAIVEPSGSVETTEYVRIKGLLLLKDELGEGI